MPGCIALLCRLTGAAIEGSSTGVECYAAFSALILTGQIDVGGATISNTGNTAAEPLSTFAAIDGAAATVSDQITLIAFVRAGFFYGERFAATSGFA
jgi:hypothetical protein